MALLILTIPAVFGVGLAAVTLIVETLAAEGSRTMVAQHPALGLEILTGMIFAAYLLCLPVKRLVERIAATRTIHIDDTTVTVTECGHFRRQTWSAPRSAFTGVAHHVRASLSGTRHELILVHPEREKSLLLSLAPRMGQSEVDRVALLLGCTEIPPSELYRFGPRLPRIVLPTWRNPAHA